MVKGSFETSLPLGVDLVRATRPGHVSSRCWKRQRAECHIGPTQFGGVYVAMLLSNAICALSNSVL